MGEMTKALSERGFTLPELLVAGGVLIVLIVGAAFMLGSNANPAVLRDAQRRIDVAMLAQGVNAYVAEHDKLPPSITSQEQFIGSADDESDLCADLVPEYLEYLPYDPVAGAADSTESCATGELDYITAYAVQRTSENTVKITAPLTETPPAITFTRSYE
jgi:type II secretory pathway pseudopilin PulG